MSESELFEKSLFENPYHLLMLVKFIDVVILSGFFTDTKRCAEKSSKCSAGNRTFLDDENEGNFRIAEPVEYFKIKKVFNII